MKLKNKLKKTKKSVLRVCYLCDTYNTNSVEWAKIIACDINMKDSVCLEFICQKHKAKLIGAGCIIKTYENYCNTCNTAEGNTVKLLEDNKTVQWECNCCGEIIHSDYL